MAHNLADRADGQGKSFFSVRPDGEKDWHKLGTYFADYPNLSGALIAGGLDYEVIKEQITRNGKPVKDKYYTVRTDTDTVLGIVGCDYKIIQNKQGFGIIDAILAVEPNSIMWESGGALFEGEKVFINCKLPDEIKVASDIVVPYILVVNSHDGSGSLKVIITPIRAVCDNTVNMALSAAKRSFSIRHTTNWESYLGEAKRALGVMHKYVKTFEETANDLLRQVFTEKQFEALIDQMAPKPENGASKRSFSVWERTRTGLITALAADDLDNIRETKWGAYNAIVDYADHYRLTRGENAVENAFVRTWDQTTFKDRGLELLLAAK